MADEAKPASGPDGKPAKKDIKEILKNLSKSEKMLVYAEGFLIVLLFLDKLVLSPIINKTKNIEIEIRQETARVRDGLMILDYKDRITREFEVVKRYFVEERMSTEEETADFLKDMEGAAKNSGIGLLSINASSTPEVTKNYSKYEIKMEALGTMDQILQFIYDVIAAEQLQKIESMELAPQGRGAEQMKFNMIISRMVITL